MKDLTITQKRDVLKALLLAVALWYAAYSASARLHANQPSRAHDGVTWGAGRLVFAQWQTGRQYQPDEYIVGGSGVRQDKAPDHWDLRIDETVEIGLRADGVLVWRRAKKQISP
jgi:hypothetical protein